jgi:hypothetical protein
VTVNALLPFPGVAMLVGANFAVTPFGNPLTASAIADLNPFTATAFKVNVVAPPAVTVALAAFAVSANVGTITVRLSACVLVSPPPVPLNVRVEMPLPALEDALIVKVLVPLPGEAMLAGVKLAVTPFGSPLIESEIADLNPPSAAADTVIAVELLAATVALAALGVSVKFGATTVTAIGAVRVSPPPVPVILTVEVPAIVLAAALMVALTGVLLVRVEEEKRTVMPVGMPMAVRVTGDANPPCAVSVIVAAAELAALTEMLETFGVSVKLALLPSFQ